MSHKNAADRSYPIFTTGVQASAEKLLWTMDIVLFLEAGTEFDHLEMILYACVYQHVEFTGKPCAADLSAV